MLAFSNDYYGMIFRATQSVELFCAYKEKTPNLFKEEHYSPHSMRHTTGQHMLEAGVPIMVIKAFLGHASVQTTQIYTESPQATVDKHIREWNEMNFPRSIYIDEKDLEERNVPDFLKSH